MLGGWILGGNSPLAPEPTKERPEPSISNPHIEIPISQFSG
jgi:hypothetical protein